MKGKEYTYLKEIFEKYLDKEPVSQDNLEFLFDLVSFFRPKKKHKTPSVGELINFLKAHPKEADFLSSYVKEIAKGKRFARMISESGISQDAHFFSELKKRVSFKMLPYQPKHSTIEYVLNQIFYKRADALWITSLPEAEICELYDLLKIESIFKSDKKISYALEEIFYSIELLLQRMSGKSVDEKVMKMTPEYGKLNSPFLQLEKEFNLLRDDFQWQNSFGVPSDNEHYKQIVLIYKQCVDFVNKAYENSAKYGITMKANQTLLSLSSQLNRFNDLLEIIVKKDEEGKVNTIGLGLKLIELNGYKNDIRDFFKRQRSVGCL